MRESIVEIRKYEASEGKVFDWADLEAHKHQDEKGEWVQEHLYAKILYLSVNDSIDNYVEVDEPVE